MWNCWAVQPASRVLETKCHAQNCRAAFAAKAKIGLFGCSFEDLDVSMEAHNGNLLFFGNRDACPLAGIDDVARPESVAMELLSRSGAQDCCNNQI